MIYMVIEINNKMVLMIILSVLVSGCVYSGVGFYENHYYGKNFEVDILDGWYYEILEDNSEEEILMLYSSEEPTITQTSASISTYNYDDSLYEFVEAQSERRISRMNDRADELNSSIEWGQIRQIEFREKNGYSQEFNYTESDNVANSNIYTWEENGKLVEVMISANSDDDYTLQDVEDLIFSNLIIK